MKELFVILVRGVDIVSTLGFAETEEEAKKAVEQLDEQARIDSEIYDDLRDELLSCKCCFDCQLYGNCETVAEMTKIDSKRMYEDCACVSPGNYFYEKIYKFDKSMTEA